MADTIATGGASPVTSSGAASFAAGSIATSIANPSASNASASTSGDPTTDFRVTLGYLTGFTSSSTNSTSTNVASASSSTPSSGSSGSQYPGILAPLGSTGGLRFPYSPSITNSQDVDYTSMTMVHANTDYHSYNHTPNVSINISGKFTVQNYQEGIYALACIHFLRSCSRMYFGENDANAGTPPPMLQLNGYGTYMYNKVRCYVRSHSWNYEENMDTVNIQLASGYYVRLPALFTLSVGLVVQNTARAQRRDFSLDNFRSGQLMETTPHNSGWI